MKKVKPSKKKSNEMPRNMDYLSFAVAVNRFENKILGIDSTEEIGLEFESSSLSIFLSAEKKEDYKMKVYDFSMMIDGAWVRMEPTIVQLIVLRRFMEKEVERVLNHHQDLQADNLKNQIESQDWQETQESLYRTQR